MEMNEGYKPPLEKSVGNDSDYHVAFGVAKAIAETALEFAKDVVPDSLKSNKPPVERPEPRIVVVEDSKQIDAIRAQLNALKNPPVNPANTRY